MAIKYFFRGIYFILISACNFPVSTPLPSLSPDSDVYAPVLKQDHIEEHVMDSIEKMMISNGLVDVLSLDSTIRVNLKYSSTDNFIHEDMYGAFDKCYLNEDAAKKLLLAQSLLKCKYPEYSLLVYDATRPLSIQQKMWDKLHLPLSEKIKYLSNPKYGSLHNYGAAVDVSIVDQNLNELDMGTGFDYFGELAYPVKEDDMLEKGRLNKTQIANRRLLREIMEKAGFFNIQTEWWHFNSCYRKEARQKYPVIR